MDSHNHLFVVAPCFNEEQSLPAFTSAIGDTARALSSRGFLNLKITLVLVDDGSTDKTWEAITHSRHPDIESVGLRLSRNFGHQAAMCAGLDYVCNELGCRDEDSVVVMDSDGQHPAFLIPEMLTLRTQGIHHVQTIRQNNVGGFFKDLSSRFFYRVFKLLCGLPLPSGAADFRCFSGFFLRSYQRFTESGRFNRGIFSFMGFRTATLEYHAHERIAGQSSYSLLRMLRLALRGVTYFSSRPLVISTLVVSLFGFALCSFYFLYETVRFASGVPFSPGWLTLFFVVTLWGSLNAACQLVIAVYLARVFDEVKGRPLYLIEQVTREADAASTNLSLTANTFKK